MRSLQEDKIKAALEMQSGDISASEILKQKIDREISMQGKIVPMDLSEEQEVFMKKLRTTGTEDRSYTQTEQNRKHFSAKKLAIGVAAACLLISGGVFAGKTAGYISGYEKAYTYAELDKAEEKLGFSPDVAEAFSNGYRFEKMWVGNTRAVDENQETVYTFPELSVSYVKDGVNDISLYVDMRPEKGEQDKEPDLTDQCGDIALRYDVYSYKFVPVGYELTEEDKANLERDDYEISEGSDEVEYAQMTHVTWEKDGMYYDLLGSDTALTGEEMFAMAKELIGAE